MSRRIEQDRAAQFLMGSDPFLGVDEARVRLERAALAISGSSASREAWGQAALLTIAQCAVRMFRGGVYLVDEFNEPVIVGSSIWTQLRRQLIDIGCRTENPPDHATSLHVGAESTAKKVALRCWTDGWFAVVSPGNPDVSPGNGNEISGALTGAMGVSEAFRKAVLDDVRAGKRTQRLSPFAPHDPRPQGIELTLLPTKAWLLGLGNLGQASLWIMGLLPYADPRDVDLLLQDMDISGAENLDTQILTTPNWLGHRKARNAAEWAEARGFQAIVTERAFTDTTHRSPEEPGLAFIGVDNLPTRRAAARPDAGFDLVIDAGLGATSAEAFDIRLHSFPGFRPPGTAWPMSTNKEVQPLSPALSKLVGEGRLDRCGAMMIAGQSVGVPSTAVAAAAIQIAQACRAIATGSYCDLIDANLVDTRRTTSHDTVLMRSGVLPFQRARHARG
jgi:hypothetical protein